MTSPSAYDIAKDTDLDVQTRLLLLQATLEREKFEREAPLARKQFRHNTPLMVTLVGIITIAANGLVAWMTASQATSDKITLTQIEAQLKESERRLSQQLARESSDAEARHMASKEERQFAFEVVQKELAKAGDTKARATVLLFLAKAGILNSLNRPALEEMAKYDLAVADSSKAQIPSTLGVNRFTSGYCYQQDYDRAPDVRGKQFSASERYAVHCHASKEHCDRARGGTAPRAGLSVCQAVSLDDSQWSPAGRGFLGSWFERQANPMGAPFPPIPQQ